MDEMVDHWYMQGLRAPPITIFDGMLRTSIVDHHTWAIAICVKRTSSSAANTEAFALSGYYLETIEARRLTSASDPEHGPSYAEQKEICSYASLSASCSNRCRIARYVHQWRRAYMDTLYAASLCGTLKHKENPSDVSLSHHMRCRHIGTLYKTTAYYGPRIFHLDF